MRRRRRSLPGRRPAHLLAAVLVGTAGLVVATRTAAGSASPTFVTPTTTTTSPVIVLPTTTRPSSVTTTTTTTTTTTSPSVQISTTAGPPPTVPPVVVGPTSSTNPDPPRTTGFDVAISTTSAPPQEGVPPGETINDLGIRGVEVTQGIQDLQSRMPLVADRRTTVRVHVGVDPGFAFVDGALLVERPGLGDEVLFPDNGPISPPSERTDLDGALNFTLEPRHFAAGSVTFTAQVWSAGGGIGSIDDEPDSGNNLLTQPVEFVAGENPTVWLVALDDGAGPGPDVTDLSVILDLAVATNDDLLDYHPISGVNFEAYPDVAAPGPEATEPGLWDLGLDQEDDPTAHDRRHEPNERMAQLVVAGVLGSEGDMILGRVDPAIPTGGFGGWAGYGVAWSKPQAGTPSHEVGHNQGLDHVGCAGDTDGDGVPQEAEAGTIDMLHPTGLPPVCSLAPIDPDGYFGYTNYRSPVTIYSNDPTHPQAAFPFMGYKNPGWPDPYHWCLLLDSYGVPCSPALIGVPPRHIVHVDCDPEPVGNYGLELCVSSGPEPPGDPGPGPLPEPAPAPDPDDLAGIAVQPATASVAMETLTITHEGFEYTLPVDPASWLVVTGTVGAAHTGSVGGNQTESVGAAIATATQVDVLPPPLARRFERAVEDAAAGLAPIATLRLVDGSGALLVAVPVGASSGGHNDGAEGGGGSSGETAPPFAAAVPWVDGAAGLELVVGGAVVGSTPIAATAPEVTELTVVVDGESIIVDGLVTVPGIPPSAGDPADARPTVDVLWSADGGATWVPVAVDVPAAEPQPATPPAEGTTAQPEGDDHMLVGFAYELPASVQLPVGDDVRIRVVAHRGGRSGQADTAVTMTAIALAESRGAPAPLLTITGLPDGPVAPYTALEVRPIIVGGLYNDDVGAVRVQFHWDGEAVGAGTSLSLRDLLTVGVHELTVTVSQPDGAVTTDTAAIEVVAAPDGAPAPRTDEPAPEVVDYVNQFQVIPDSVGAAPTTTGEQG